MAAIGPQEAGASPAAIKHAGWLGCHCPVVEADGTRRVLVPTASRPKRTMLIPKASARINDILARGRPQRHRQRTIT